VEQKIKIYDTERKQKGRATMNAEEMADNVIEECIKEGMLNSTVQHIKQTTSFHKVAKKGILLGMEHPKIIKNAEVVETAQKLAFKQGIEHERSARDKAMEEFEKDVEGYRKECSIKDEVHLNILYTTAKLAKKHFGGSG